MNIALKTVCTMGFVAALCLAIAGTDDELWLGVWFLLFFFAGIPLCLLVLKDLLMSTGPKWLGPSQLLLHICALFAAVVGYFLGIMAVSSEHEKAYLHELMAVIFPLMVYAAPLLMMLQMLHGMPWVRVKSFYFKPDNDGEQQ